MGRRNGGEAPLRANVEKMFDAQGRIESLEEDVLPRIFHRLESLDATLHGIGGKLDLIMAQNYHLEQLTNKTHAALREMATHMASSGASAQRIAKELDN